VPGSTSVPTWKSPSPSKATFFSPAALPAPFSPPDFPRAEADAPLPVSEPPPSPPPAFADTAPMTAIPTTAPSAILPFMPMAVSPPDAETAATGG
jgi:hypothetical protein